MRPFILSAAIACLVALGGTVAAVPVSTARPATPKVKVGPANFKAGTAGIKCARIGGRWVAGQVVRGSKIPTGWRWFSTYDAQAASYSKVLRKKGLAGARRNALQRDRTRLIALATKGTRACASTPTPTPTPTPVSSPAPGAPSYVPARFSIGNAIALTAGGTTAQAQGASALSSLIHTQSSGGMLSVVTPSGSIRSAVISGDVSVSNAVIAPDGRVFLVFSRGTDLENAGPYGFGSCFIAEVDKATGIPTCVANDIWSVTPKSYRDRDGRVLQFDAAGNLYYLGYKSGGQTVLRRVSPTGEVSEMLAGAVYIADWTVLPSGELILTGQTTATNTAWTRRISPAGSLTTLSAFTMSFVECFPDGNAYLGNENSQSVNRYLANSGVISPSAWIGPMTTPTPDNDSAIVGSDGSSLAAAPAILNTGQVIGGAGYPGGRTQLLEYYPHPQVLSTSIAAISALAAIDGKVAIAGQTVGGVNALTIYTRATDSEVTATNAAGEIEYYHLIAAPGSGKILFDGLRFADNKYVIGEIDPGTATVRVTSLTGTKLTSFAAF